MPDEEMKLTPKMRQAMAKDRKIVRGYLRNAIFVFQSHMARRALRDLDLKQDDLSEELLAQIATDTGSYMGKFRDWLLIELNRANAKPKSTN